MEVNYFTILYWFWHTSTLICYRYTRVPHPERPCLLPPRTIPLYARQQKRHRCIEQSFGLCGRGRGWDDLGEWHWNTYNIICEMNRQPRFNAWHRMFRAGALGWPRGMVWGGRSEGGSGWGTCVYPWRIHVDIWQNQYNIVK